MIKLTWYFAFHVRAYNNKTTAIPLSCLQKNMINKITFNRIKQNKKQTNKQTRHLFLTFRYRSMLIYLSIIRRQRKSSRRRSSSTVSLWRFLCRTRRMALVCVYAYASAHVHAMISTYAATHVHAMISACA